MKRRSWISELRFAARPARLACALALLAIPGCSSDEPASTDAAVRDAAAQDAAASADTAADATATDGTLPAADGPQQPPPADAAVAQSDLPKDLPTVFGGARPANLRLPAGYDPAKPYPLVVVLHGYGSSGKLHEAYFQYTKLAAAGELFTIAPEGTDDVLGAQCWNAMAATSGGYTCTADDAKYLADLIKSIQAVYSIDAQRVFLVGHSQGGFMAFRMACDHAPLIAAVVVLSGATYDDKSDCTPAKPVSVLNVHGDADVQCSYDGGRLHPLLPRYPSAEQTVIYWAGYDGCQTQLKQRPDKLDLDDSLPGAETTVAGFDGCPAGIDVSLWRIIGGEHVPEIGSGQFLKATWDWLKAHPRP